MFFLFQVSWQSADELKKTHFSEAVIEASQIFNNDQIKDDSPVESSKDNLTEESTSKPSS